MILCFYTTNAIFVINICSHTNLGLYSDSGVQYHENKLIL